MDIDSVHSGFFFNKTGHAAFGVDTAILIVRVVHLELSRRSAMSMARHQTSLWAWILLILSWMQQRQDLQPASSIPYIHACFPTGSVAQVPNDLTDWSPAVPFDVAYASAVAHHLNALPQGFLDGWEVLSWWVHN